MTSDVQYEIFYTLPITIVAHQNYHNTIMITMCNSIITCVNVSDSMNDSTKHSSKMRSISYNSST